MSHQIEKQTSGGRWIYVRHILIIVAVFQILMILNYHYDLRKYIYVPVKSNDDNAQTKGHVHDVHHTDLESKGINKVDIHTEDEALGHTWSDVHIGHNNTPAIVPNSIAIGMGVISSKSQFGNAQEIATTFPFFRKLMPSFCKTASVGYSYNFFLAYDINDKCFTKMQNLVTFKEVFQNFTSTNCPGNSSYFIHFVQCTHKGTPARAQNDAMMEAYMSNMEYYYRINDDTNMEKAGWTEAFINILKGYKPSNVGVVGPNHKGGNNAILTYDFVHYTHVNIFGYYYPRLFTGWYADDWITKVYRPARSTKAKDVVVTHTLEFGTRYKVDYSISKKLSKAIVDSQAVLNRYIAAINETHEKPSGDKVISMSLSGKNPRYTFGAIRNAQLLPVYFPEWKLRIYVPSAKHNESVPIRVLNKLQLLGVELIVVNSHIEKYKPEFWKYLVIDDEQVKYFLIKNSHNRFSDKNRLLTKEWMLGDATCLSIKDMKQHVNMSFVDGLIAGKNPAVKEKLGQNVEKYLVQNNQTTLNTFLETFLVEKLKDYTIYYDTVSLNPAGKVLNINLNNTNSVPLSTVFDEFNQNITSTET